VPARAWLLLLLGVLAQSAVTIFVSAPAFLIPLLVTRDGMSLPQAGLLASTPTIGILLTLIAWGAIADRWGERWVMVGGLALTAVSSALAILTQGTPYFALALILGGIGAASPNLAGGRLVVGWFPRERRGLAMGIRQLAQPFGVMIAAIVVPPLANQSIGAALAVPLFATAIVAVLCAIGVVNPPRPDAAAAAATAEVPGDAAVRTRRTENPYRRSSFLARLHGASVLLVIPQATLATFGLVWLVVGHGWAETTAGLAVGLAQGAGGLGRVVAGLISDRVSSRLRPMRWVAIGACVTMTMLAAVDRVDGVALALVLIAATTFSTADNGLAFTAAAEVAGPAWSGRVLGVQNTAQFLATAVVGPAVGALIGVVGYPIAFLVVAVFPAIAIPVIPRADAESPP
jgi:MFS family permease